MSTGVEPGLCNSTQSGAPVAISSFRRTGADLGGSGGAPGVPPGALAVQAEGSSVSNEGSRFSREGPRPSGDCGQRWESPYSTEVTMRPALSWSSNRSPPLARLPPNHPATATPGWRWRKRSGLESLATMIRPPAGIGGLGVGNRKSIPLNWYPETSSGTDPAFQSSRYSKASPPAGWYWISEIDTGTGVAADWKSAVTKALHWVPFRVRAWISTGGCRGSASA